LAFCPAQSGGNADRIERRLGANQQQRHAHNADRRGGDRAGPGRRAQPAPRHEQDDHRLESAQCGSDAARKPVSRDEQQHPEQREVEAAQQKAPPEPGARRHATGQDQEKQACGQGPQGRERHGIACGQGLGRDQVGAAPDRRGERGKKNVGAA